MNTEIIDLDSRYLRVFSGIILAEKALLISILDFRLNNWKSAAA